MSSSTARNKKVFISYCHDDNDEVLGDQWVEQFHRYLGTRLKQILGRGNEPRIWRDEILQGNQDFADVLVEELHTSAVLISVLTPSYVESEWCRREVEEFARAAEAAGGVKIGRNQKRIFKVEKTPVDRSRHPPILQGQTGYRFYIKDPEKGRPSELSLAADNPEKRAKALEVIEDLAYHIIGTLNAMTGTEAPARRPATGDSSESAAKPVPAVDESRPVIYLAETSFDISDERTEVRRELQGQGYRVLPEGQLPVTSPDQFDDAVRECLAQSQLVIQMIGTELAHSPAGHREDVVVLQNRLAAGHSGENAIRRLIWLPEGCSSGDETQQAFIDSLQRDPAMQGGADVVQGPVQELMTSILDAVRKIEEKQQQSSAAPPSSTSADAAARSSIYVCYSREDKETVEPLLDYLFKNDFDLLEPPWLDEAAKDQQLLARHKENVRACDGMLVFAVNGTESWLKTQIGELLKAPHYRDNSPLLARAIYLGGGMSGARVRSRDLIMRDEGDFSPDVLTPFLEQLGSAGETQQ